MTYARDDRWLTDAQGRALAGATVYYVTQPVTSTNIPPAPLATVYSDSSGTVGSSPLTTDGFGHCVAYLDPTQLYTIVVNHPLFLTPMILYDQAVNSAASGFRQFAGKLSGTLDGTNKVFILTLDGTNQLPSTPTQLTVWDNFPLIKGVGYTLAGIQVTFTIAPSMDDKLYAQGLY